MKQIDLHVHSTCSDGTYTPTQLVDYAIEKGLSAFALTDHDSVDGIKEALSYAEALRSQLPIEQRDTVPEIIPGIELSSEYQGRDIHVLGLYIDPEQKTFAEHLKSFVESRHNRNRKMCAKLRERGIDITYEALLEMFPGSVITRAHYGKYMLEKGYISSIKEAFQRYIGDRGPCFIPREKITPAQAVELILQAGGIPILAHPILYGMGNASLEQLIAELKAEGLRGIEAIYSTYSPADERQIRSLAEKYDLLLSGGSDFHGSNKPGLDLGTGYGKLFVPEDLLYKIKSERTSAAAANYN